MIHPSKPINSMVVLFVLLLHLCLIGLLWWLPAAHMPPSQKTPTISVQFIKQLPIEQLPDNKPLAKPNMPPLPTPPHHQPEPTDTVLQQPQIQQPKHTPPTEENIKPKPTAKPNIEKQPEVKATQTQLNIPTAAENTLTQTTDIVPFAEVIKQQNRLVPLDNTEIAQLNANQKAQTTTPTLSSNVSITSSKKPKTNPSSVATANNQTNTKPETNTSSPNPKQLHLLSDQEIEFLNNVQAQYPFFARNQNQQGTVLVWVLINTQGKVENAFVQQSSGYTLLDKAALEAAQTSTFKPYQENGVKKPAYALIPYEFTFD